MSADIQHGARLVSDSSCRFSVWAPRVERVEVHLFGEAERLVALEPRAHGYHEAVVEDVAAGTRYLYRLDGDRERPDPASLAQPEGVHAASQVIDVRFDWDDDRWAGLDLAQFVFYEIHVGTFTREGTFEAIIPHLDELVRLGITAVELMPVAQFPGQRNWGYDGTYPFATQHSYGGALGLQRLVNACHRKGLAVVLDVVYNHLGPEGNYLGEFGPYFTERYRTPWGPAINFDGACSDEVRAYFVENALHWLRDFRIDALRLDAIHGIFDFSAYPFLAQLQDEVENLAKREDRQLYLIAESDLNDTRIIRPAAQGGMGLPAQWCDDLHHAVHTLLTGERDGYYADFGELEHLVKAFKEGFVYSGQNSRFRKRRHGNSSADLSPEQFVVFAQNHDQVGNRVRGDRLGQLVPFEAQKLAASLVLLSPYLPLLFMGEEYGETAPFCYFVSHTDPALVEAVRRGRKEEFAAFAWKGEPPDPQAEQTFVDSRLNWNLREQEPHRTLLEYHRELLRLRKSNAILSALHAREREVLQYEREHVICVHRWNQEASLATIFHVGGDDVQLRVQLPTGVWRKRLDSADDRWRGGGARVPEVVESDNRYELELPPWSCVLLERDLSDRRQ